MVHNKQDNMTTGTKKLSLYLNMERSAQRINLAYKLGSIGRFLNLLPLSLHTGGSSGL